MKSYRNLYPQIATFQNLLDAFNKARKGKRGKAGVAAFEYNLERELLRLEHELKEETWRPGGYTSFYVTDPKRRKISAAPFRDRVVHHALVNMTGPIYERQFIHDSYANQVGKGTHRAMDRCTQFVRGNRYVLQGDIAQFFPSVDHAILRDILARPLRDEPTMRLMEHIIASGVGVLDSEYTPHWFPQDFDASDGQGSLLARLRPRGLPIGNLTSQFWANVLLNELDQYVKRGLKCKAYIRYVDDFLLFHNDKAQLQEWKLAIAAFLDNLRLQLHPRKSVIFPSRLGVTFLGFRHFATHRRLRMSNVLRFRRKLQRLANAYAAGELLLEKVNQSVQSWVSHAAHGDTWQLRQAMLSSVPLRPPARTGAAHV